MAGGLAMGAQIVEDLPQLQGVGVTQNLGAQVPLDLQFRNSAGESVSLGQFFQTGRPVALTLNYANCPQLCNLQLDGLVAGLDGMEWSAGREFQLITVSIDPTDTPQRFNVLRDKLLGRYSRTSAFDGGWEFLTGSEASIQSLAKSVGFGYKRVELTGDYAHAAALILLTPTGQVSRYLDGVLYDSNTLRLSLVESAGGAIGSYLDAAFLTCFYYDSSAGTYAPAVMTLTRIAGAVLVFFGVGLFFRTQRRNRFNLA